MVCALTSASHPAGAFPSLPEFSTNEPKICQCALTCENEKSNRGMIILYNWTDLCFFVSLLRPDLLNPCRLNMVLSRNETEIWTEEHMDTNHTTDSFSLEVVIVPVVFGCIFFVGIIGNTLVMVVIGKVKSRRSRSTTNIFILNLSIADLSFLLFCVPFQATIYSLPRWIFGAFLCRFVHYFFMVCMLVSIFTLVAMSVDRYIAVVLSQKSPCIRKPEECAHWRLCHLDAFLHLCSPGCSSTKFDRSPRGSQ